MNLRLYFIVTFIFLYVNCYSQDDRWIKLGQKNNISIYLDTETIRKVDYEHSFIVYHKIFDEIDQTSSIELCEYNCENRTLIIKVTTVLNSLGKFIETYKSNQKYDIIPESNWESVLNYLCK